MLPALYAFTYFDCTKNYLKSMGIDYPVLVIHTFTTVNYYINIKRYYIFICLNSS